MTNLEIAAKLEAALSIIRELKYVPFSHYAAGKVVDVEEGLEQAIKFLKIQGWLFNLIGHNSKYMTDLETLTAATDGTGLSFFDNGDNSFSFRQIDAGFTTGLALGTFDFQESLAFVKGWKAAKGMPNKFKADLVFKMSWQLLFNPYSWDMKFKTLSSVTSCSNRRNFSLGLNMVDYPKATLIQLGVFCWRLEIVWFK